MHSLIYQFQHVTRLHTKIDFALFVTVVFLYMLLLYIERCPPFELCGKVPIYGNTLKAQLINLGLDAYLSILLAITTFIILN